jgi:hypothetical protein
MEEEEIRRDTEKNQEPQMGHRLAQIRRGKEKWRRARGRRRARRIGLIPFLIGPIPF